MRKPGQRPENPGVKSDLSSLGFIPSHSNTDCADSAMSILYPHLRIHQIFGANTNVGKTVLTTALCRVNAKLRSSPERKSETAGRHIFYLKPVSTGSPEDADDGKVNASHVIS